MDANSPRQPLASGHNRVIDSFPCDGPAGRLFEITAEGETVWEYWNPGQSRLGGQTVYDDRGGRDTDHAVYRAVRYPKQYVDRIIEDLMKKAE